MPTWPSIIRFGDTKATEQEVADLGFMPTDEALARRKKTATFRQFREKCTLAARATLPKSTIPVDVIVDGDAERGDTLRLRFAEFITPDLSDLTSRNLEILKVLFDTFFDILIELATRREKHADKLVGGRVNPESPHLQGDVQVEFFDYISERVKINNLERKREKKNASVAYYKRKRFDVDQKMVDVYRRQGLMQDGDSEQGRR